MWTTENVARVIYAILGVGLVLLIIDTVFVDLPTYLIVLGVCALVFGGSAIVGVSARRIINREDCWQVGKLDMWTNERVALVIYGILGLGFLLLIIDTVFVDLPIYLISLGICALVIGSVATIGGSVRRIIYREDCSQAGKLDMWTNKNVALVIYGVLGLGFVLLIIDTVVVDLPIDLIVLGICALVLGGVAIIGVSVRQIINREDVE